MCSGLWRPSRWALQRKCEQWNKSRPRDQPGHTRSGGGSPNRCCFGTKLHTRPQPATLSPTACLSGTTAVQRSSCHCQQVLHQVTPKSLNKQQKARASDLGTAWPAPPVTAISPAASEDLSHRIAVPGGVGQPFLKRL